MTSRLRPVIPGRRLGGEPGIHMPQRRDYGFRLSRCALGRNDAWGEC